MTRPRTPAELFTPKEIAAGPDRRPDVEDYLNRIQSKLALATLLSSALSAEQSIVPDAETSATAWSYLHDLFREGYGEIRTVQDALPFTAINMPIRKVRA